MIATPTVTKCPRCRGTSVTALAREEDRQRFQCNNCHENFIAPAEPDLNLSQEPATATKKFSFLPIAAPDASENLIGLVKATCEKCGKPYHNLGKRYDHHIATCDGKVKWKAPGSRRRRQQMPGGDQVQGAQQTYTAYLETLKARKLLLEMELRAVDGLIAETEKLKGVGGAAQVPFSDGAAVSRC